MIAYFLLSILYRVYTGIVNFKFGWKYSHLVCDIKLSYFLFLMAKSVDNIRVSDDLYCSWKIDVIVEYVVYRYKYRKYKG
jgi:hypothetical protein